jgi:serine/threonine protein kinase
VEDVQNEIRAVEKLCKPGTHENLVALIRHGQLPPSYYFLDMELCDLNLEVWIGKKWTAAMKGTVPYFTANPPPHIRMAHMWKIIMDITRGVAFIHDHGEIHRDLKPSNSISFVWRLLTLLSSIFAP